jgi:hypothetical protein
MPNLGENKSSHPNANRPEPSLEMTDQEHNQKTGNSYHQKTIQNSQDQSEYGHILRCFT